MIPIYLKLYNFMSHEDTEIDFNKIDVACIQGPNGSGKSAIVDGILYALFGQTSRGKDEDIVRLGSQEMTVIFDFEQTAQAYRIVRKKNIAGRGKNIVELYSLANNGEISALATGDSAKEMMLNIIHRDFSTFISSSFLLQGQGERLIAAKPSERYKIVFNILWLECYEEYRKKAVARKNKIEGQRSVLIEGVEEFKTQAESLKDMEFSLEQKKAELKTLFEVLEKNEKDLIRINSELAVVNTKINEIEQDSEILKALENEKAELVLLKYNFENSVKAIPVFEQEIQNLYNQYVIKENGLHEIMTLLAEQKVKQRTADMIKKEINNLDAQSVTIQKSIAETEKHIERYKKILDNKQKILMLIEEEKAINSKLQSLRQEREEISLKINALNIELRKISDLNSDLTKLQGIVSLKQKDREHEIKTLKKRIEQAEKKASLIEQSVCRAQGDFSKCPFIKDAVTERNCLEKLKKQLEELEKPLDIPEIKEIEIKKKQLESLDVNKNEENIKKETEQLKMIAEKIASMEKRLEIIASWTKQASEIKTAEIEVLRAEKIIQEQRKAIEEISNKKGELDRQLTDLGNIASLIDITEAVISRLKIYSEVKTIKDKLEVIEKNITGKKSSLEKTLGYQLKKKDLIVESYKTSSLLEKLKTEEKNCLLEITDLESNVLTCKKAYEKVKDMEKENILTV